MIKKVRQMIKRNIVFMTLAAMLAAACAGNSGTQDEAFATDSLKYETKSKTAEIHLKADYPKTGNAILTAAVREYISEELGGNYNGNLANGDSVLAFYGKEQTERLNKEAEAYNGSENAPTLYCSEEIKTAAETDNYISYTAYSEMYLGGAHGMSAMTGTTFRKSDGRRFGAEMLRNTDTEDFRKLIKEGLMEYFSAADPTINTDGQLKTMLLTDHGVDFLPMPQSQPYLTEDGVVFTYQPYEIAPYAAGRPTFTVGYDKIKPYLTQTVINLIGR